ncbi:MAG: hypothetical protein BWK72_20490 [Rhodoferax ferrireducens]|uniref:Uncharacterized protein n=1 Tax=Rhodoferax ferrireducens TaxID=192843 RepID=A0A1W9KNR6_9BURK|nr:MAG: hypothetical protein BWK72_20490 [Rhodoferax ferrireducens]
MNIQNTPEEDAFSDFELPPLQGISPHVISAHNDKIGLQAIHKFGWLRTREIGNILWANNPTRHISGARIARKWLKNKWVMQKTLPYGHGPAYLLTKIGADFLTEEYGIEAWSGKKIGDHIEQDADSWKPSLNWRHDLIANSFLTMCMGGGMHVVSELELRRKYPNAKKIPDGLIERDEVWWGIEIERSAKWSSNMRQLASSLIHVAHHPIEYEDKLINTTCLVYEDPLTAHHDGQNLFDHFGRVKRASQALLKKGETFTLVAIPVKLKGGAVIEITTPLIEVIGASYEEHYNRSLTGLKWNVHDDKSMDLDFSSYTPFSVSIEPTNKSKNDWLISFSQEDDLSDYEEFFSEKYSSMSELAIQRKALELLLKSKQYRTFFYEKWYAEEIANRKEKERLANEEKIKTKNAELEKIKISNQTIENQRIAQEKEGGFFGFLKSKNK